MNQPFSSCLTYYEERINMSPSLQLGPTTSQSNIQPTFRSDNLSQELPEYMDTSEDAPPTCPLPPLPSVTSQNPEDRQSPFWIKQHPTSSRVFGHGETFMDQFDKDQFAEARNQGLLYYPFATRDEWELASFLLQSNLSMNAIDRFLKLELVSHPLRKWYTLHSYHNFLGAGKTHWTFLSDSKRSA
jgi:hypothetical protein